MVKKKTNPDTMTTYEQIADQFDGEQVAVIDEPTEKPKTKKAKKGEPDVSVLMRIRDGIAGYPDGSLYRAIQSAFNQPDINVEVIAVNNGSTDNTGEMLDLWKDEYPVLKIITVDENIGEAEAMNVGAENASARYCIQLTARSWFEENALAPMVAELDKVDSEAFVFGCMQVSGAITRYHRPPAWNRRDYARNFLANFFMFPRWTWEKGLRFVDYIQHGTPDGVGICDRDYMMQLVYELDLDGIPLRNLHVINYHYSGQNQMSSRVQANRGAIDREFNTRWGKYLR